MATGFKIWMTFFLKIWRFTRNGSFMVLLRKPTRSFRLLMRMSVENVDPQRWWIRKHYRRAYNALLDPTSDAWCNRYLA